MRAHEFVIEKKKKRRPRWAAYGPGPYGGYGYYAGYSGDSSGSGGGSEGGGGGESVNHEASYPGNIGMMELAKFFQIANPEQKQLFKQLLEKGKKGLAWKLIQDITDTKLQGKEFEEDVPQPGASSGAPKQFGSDAEIESRQMTAKQIISSIPGVPYYNNVVDDWDAKDFSWGVTKKVIEYAEYLKQHPESLAKLPPILVLNGKFEDGAHRVSAIWLLQQRMDPKNPIWNNAKLNVQFVKQGMAENFADGKKPGRKGLAKRSGVNTKASVSDLRKTAKNSSGEKQRMAHWLANMKAGRAKKNK